MNDQTAEAWRKIPGYGGYYEASSIGRVRSAEREVNGFSARGNRPVKVKRKEHVLAQQWRGHNHRYAYVNLYVDGKECREQVHTLVLMAFVGHRPDGMQACHGPNGSRDNGISNLRWDTPEENRKDIERHGRRLRGELVGTAKLNAEQVNAIRNGIGPAEAKRVFGIGKTQYYRIKKGESWKHEYMEIAA